MSEAEIHLYIDDSGSRYPDRAPKEKRRDDEMDYFALGGVLINEEDGDEVFAEHKAFCDAYSIDYPLHSWAIRGGREDFGWLKKPEAAFAFLTDLEKMLGSLPIVGIAAVIDRPGYVARYPSRVLWRLVPYEFLRQRVNTRSRQAISQAAKFGAMTDAVFEVPKAENGIGR